MSMKLSDEEIWNWHNILEEQKVSGLSVVKFCKKYKHDYNRFTNLKFRLIYISLSQPQEYERLTKFTRELMASELPISKFCNLHKLNKKVIAEVQTHLNYLDIIERIKLERGDEPTMNFVQIKSTITDPIYQLNPPATEVIEPKNDIEIAITKGVRVSVSPHIDSSKIIRIIELLKDL